jgi:hypothetical protein
VIPPELLPISENSAIGHQSLHCFPVSRKTRPQQTCGKDAFVAGLRFWLIDDADQPRAARVLGIIPAKLETTSAVKVKTGKRFRSSRPAA